MSTSHEHLNWPRLSYREQYKDEDEETDRENDGKTTSKSGLALSGMTYYGKLKTARSRSGCKIIAVPNGLLDCRMGEGAGEVESKISVSTGMFARGDFPPGIVLMYSTVLYTTFSHGRFL